MTKQELVEFIAKEANCKSEELLDWDLFLYNMSEPTIWGLNNEFFSSPKIDDLQCAYSAFKAILDSKPSDRIAIISLFDNEEVGSGTRQGALSDFLTSIMERIMFALHLNEDEKYINIASSFMISADNGHGVHPNYSDKSDVTNLPKLNNGILINFTTTKNKIQLTK